MLTAPLLGSPIACASPGSVASVKRSPRTGSETFRAMLPPSQAPGSSLFGAKAAVASQSRDVSEEPCAASSSRSPRVRPPTTCACPERGHVGVFQENAVLEVIEPQPSMAELFEADDQDRPVDRG